jgi:hypothetical protein
MAGSRERGNIHSGSIKGGKLLLTIDNYQTNAGESVMRFIKNVSLKTQP